MKSTVETKIIELVKLGHELAKELHCAESAALVSDLASQLDVQFARSNALAAENAGLKSKAAELVHEASEVYSAYNSTITEPDGDFMDMQTLQEMQCVETPATDAFLAEVRAHDINAFIQHHSAELDAHIKNGGEQFDEKSVRIRDIIVSARLFMDQLRKGGAA
ncbi:hypothetical protein KDV22_09895 [Citrobacter koseri]|uniref:hypothetical protein n=1 Tax=Citrobacter koseri TaxID=545 RepID=UPI003336B653